MKKIAPVRLLRRGEIAAGLAAARLAAAVTDVILKAAHATT